MKQRDPNTYTKNRRGHLDMYIVGVWCGYHYTRWIEGLSFSNTPELYIEYQDAIDALNYVEDEHPEVAGCLDILKVSSTHHSLGDQSFGKK